jgi:hypothetical protein
MLMTILFSDYATIGYSNGPVACPSETVVDEQVSFSVEPRYLGLGRAHAGIIAKSYFKDNLI